MVQSYGVACRRLGIVVVIISVISTLTFIFGSPDSRIKDPDTTLDPAASPVAAKKTADSGRQKWMREPYFHLTAFVVILSYFVMILTRVLLLSLSRLLDCVLLELMC
jgi:hypothetical protein